MGNTIRNICFVFAVLFSLNALAQSSADKIVFRNLDERLGLSNSNVLSIIRDNDGLMWYGTAYGLYRYDGTRIKAFFNTKDSTSISNHYVNKLFIGPKNELWIQNVNGVFDIYNPDTENFIRGTSVFQSVYKMASDSIGTLLKDRQNRFWFAHPNKGISIYEEQKEATLYLSHSNQVGSLSSDQITGMCEAPNGMVWAVNSAGTIDIIDPNQLIVTKTVQLPKNQIPSSASYEIMIDSDGDAWIYNPERDLGIFRVDGFTQEIEKSSDKGGEYAINNTMIKAVLEAKKGEIWLGTDHGGINVIHKETGKVTYLGSDDSKNDLMPHNVIYALYKDTEGIIWVGTHKQGISYYHQGLLRFSHEFKNFSDPKSLPYNDVNAFAEDKLGNLYLGTNGNGLYYHNKETNSYTHFTHISGDSSSLIGDVIVDLTIDRAGVLWIGTYLNGLSSFDGNKFTNYYFDPTAENGIPGPSIWKIFEDSEQNLWIGTLRAGLSILDPERKEFSNYAAGAPPYYINNQYITGIIEDQAGNVWVAGGSGINSLNIHTKESEFYSSSQDLGLIDDKISDIFMDSKGVIWVPTVAGLHYFDATDSVFYHYGQNEGLPTGYLVDMLEDDQNNLWISSQMGLSYAKVDRSTSPFSLSFQNFDQKDGLQASLFNKNSALKTDAGEFIFGGPNGYNIFKSENFAFERKNPDVVFTDFQLFNEEVEIGREIGNRVLLPKALERMEKLVLRHDENIFSIGFSALNYLYPEKNKYRYKLLGFNEDWINLNDELAKVTFTNLDPGDYTLVVQPGTVLDGWSPDEYKLDIQILGPFWKTPIAYALYLLIILVIIFYYRRQMLKRQQDKFDIEQEKVETKRMQELDRLKTKFFTNLSHEFRTPLSLILTPTNHLISQTENRLLLSQYKIIQRNARRLLKLINQLLDVKNIENGGIAYYPSEGDIIQFIKDCLADFYELSENKNIRLSFDSNTDSQQAIFDPDKLEKILFNLLSNAIKFTSEDGDIGVSVELVEDTDDKGTLILSISDSGTGISEKVQERIFERFYTTEGFGEKLNQGSGIGLSLSQDFAKAMNGEITVKSEEFNGSIFTLTMPLGLIVKDQVDEVGSSEEDLIDSYEVILIAEDHAEFRQYLKDCLSDTYKVITAKNGLEAWELAQQHIPDLIISDYMMPKMDGQEFCKNVKTNITTSHIPVILLTAKKSEETMLLGLDSGCNLYLTKPFNLEVLQLSIKNLLRERRVVQEQNRSKIEIKTSQVEVVSLDDKLIQNAISIVEKHLDDPQLSVEFLSKELGMSRVHLYKKVQSLTGKSPIEFIRLIRMKRAAQLLSKSQLNVAEVAYSVGYNNAKYFSKHFKVEFELLPSEYAAKQAGIQVD